MGRVLPKPCYIGRIHWMDRYNKRYHMNRQTQMETRTLSFYEVAADTNGEDDMVDAVWQETESLPGTINLRKHRYFLFKTDYSAVLDIGDDRLYLNIH